MVTRGNQIGDHGDGDLSGSLTGNADTNRGAQPVESLLIQAQEASRARRASDVFWDPMAPT